MKRFSEQLHKKANTVRLRVAEKRELRERLVSYMEYHPLPTEMKEASAPKLVQSPIVTEAYKVVKVPFHALFKYSALAAVVVLVVIPFVAERAVPGDVLYAVKVQFNEELRSTLTFDGYQKVEWETERLNRRIAEARLLASEGRLTEEVEAEVVEAVKTHTENAKREIEVLRSEDADEATIASIALDTTLEVQSTSLKGGDDVIAEDEAEEVMSRSVNLIADAIDASRSGVVEQKDSSTLPAFAKLMARVEQNTTRIHELLSVLQEVAPSDELAEVQRRIEDVDRSIQATIELVEIDDMEARASLVNVLQRTQRLIVYMTELEVTETVDIETLVPVELTEAEQKDEMNKLREELEMKQVQIEEMLSVITEEGVVEKIELARASVTDLVAEMASSTEDFVAFKSIAQEAITLSNDSIAVLEQYVEPVAPEAPVEEEEVASSTESEIIEPEVSPEEITASSSGEDLSSEQKVGENGTSTEGTEDEMIDNQ